MRRTPGMRTNHRRAALNTPTTNTTNGNSCAIGAACNTPGDASFDAELHTTDNTTATAVHAIGIHAAPQRNHAAVHITKAASNSTPHAVCAPNKPLPGTTRLSAAWVPR